MNTTVTKHSPLIILHGLDSAREKIAEWIEEKPILNDVVSDQVVLNDENPLVWDGQQLVFISCESELEFEGNN